MEKQNSITIEIFKTEALVRALDMHDSNALFECKFVYKFVSRLENWDNHAECTIKAVLDTNV